MGTLVEWLVKPGDEVAPGAIVAVVETQKGAIEVETFAKGRIVDILVPAGRRFRSAKRSRISTTGSRRRRLGRAGRRASRPGGRACALLPPSTARQRRRRRARVKASPVARRRAAELGVDLSRVTGTGPSRRSISSAPTSKGFRPAEAPRAAKGKFDAGEMRKAIAAAMSRAKREIPHYYLSDTLDMSRALAWLEDFNAEAAAGGPSAARRPPPQGERAGAAPSAAIERDFGPRGVRSGRGRPYRLGGLAYAAAA